MTDEQLVAIMARTDAAAAFLMGVLIDQGVISKDDMGERLDQAIASAKQANNGEILASVFTSMKSLLEKHQPKPELN